MAIQSPYAPNPLLVYDTDNGYKVEQGYPETCLYSNFTMYGYRHWFAPGARHTDYSVFFFDNCMNDDSREAVEEFVEREKPYRDETS